MRNSSCLILLLAAALPAPARALQVRATSSTQYLWYEDLLSDHHEQADVAEYLRLDATGLDGADKASVHAYGRLIGQLQSNIEDRATTFDDTIGRLYYLFLDYHDALPGHLDLQVGRTYVPAAALPGMVDGLYLRARGLGLPGLGATAYGGHRVIFDAKGELDRIGDALFGGSLYLDAAKQTHAELSYTRTYSDGDFAREIVALDLSTTPQAAVNLVGRLRWDLVSARTDELLLGVNLFPVERLTLRAEYCQSSPTFDRLSFYRYFGVTDYKELGASAEWRFTEAYRLTARYAAEDFDRSSRANVLEGGLFLHPVTPLTLNVGYLSRRGFGDRLSGVRFDGAWQIGKAVLRAGIDYDDFRRADVGSDSAKKYWASGELQLNKWVGAVLRAEEDVTFAFSHAYQGFVALNLSI